MTQAKPDTPPPAAPRVTRAFIDGIEEGTARLLLQDRSDGPGEGEWRTYKLPAAALPQEAHEGDWIELSVRLIPPPEAAKPGPSPHRRKKNDGGDFAL